MTSTTLAHGTSVHLADDDPDEPTTVIGTIVEPTAAELAEGDNGLDPEVEDVVVVRWPSGRRTWEYAEDLAALDGA